MKRTLAHTMSRTHSPATASTARFATRGSNAGFTIIEVLVTALIVILIASASAKALITTSHISGDQRLRAQANSVATQDLERLRGVSDDQLNSLNQARTETIGGTTFNVTSVATYLDTTGATTCTSTSAAYYKLSSTVTWSETGFSNRTDTTVTQESVLARPVTGDMFVQVTDQTGQPLSGASVTATGPDTQSNTTNSAGCVLFAGLSPGGYNVTFADSGYVDPNGNASPSVSATVAATTPTAPSGNPFHLGRAGSIAGTFTTSAGATGEADGISWLGSGASYGMSGGYRNVTSAATATALTTAGMFPFYGTSGYTNNYAVWGGQCQQQGPPSPNDQQTIDGTGSSSPQNIQEPQLNLQTVTYSSTTYFGFWPTTTTTSVKPDNVTMTFVSRTGATCTDGWPATLSAATVANEPTTGWLANPGQPYANGTSGTLTVCASSGGHHASVTTTNTNFATPTTVPTIAISSTGASGACT